MNNQLLAHLVDINSGIRSKLTHDVKLVQRTPHLRRRPLTLWGRIKRFFFAP